MTADAGEPLLVVEQLEVAYHRVVTAVQGVSLSVPRAISGFLGIDVARVTEGRIL